MTPTLRDAFAMAALPALIGRLKGLELFLESDVAMITERAYAIADAMLLERAKT